MEEFVDFVAEKEPVIQDAPPKKRKALSRLSRFLTNKYFIASIGFLGVMTFLDKNDLITTMERREELNNLNQSKEHYLEELSELRKVKADLETDPVIIEKLAREKYLMKRENEDIFVTEDKSQSITAK
ncbi:FtsB family cell division protein [Niabella ginsengisoli]|uniref:Septum formation initiator family protein n=1 Tax=Niabella ginsengisoli TaxID=522298 RepID=A0ABS9SII5_9BACT|nr:septum formation initiator family protein [Niabella ginsengisoli]MCH5598172.1 septum formation initiator family protein [Niabella ginsengisoli]